MWEDLEAHPKSLLFFLMIHMNLLYWAIKCPDKITYSWPPCLQGDPWDFSGSFGGGSGVSRNYQSLSTESRDFSLPTSSSFTPGVWTCWAEVQEPFWSMRQHWEHTRDWWWWNKKILLSVDCLSLLFCFVFCLYPKRQRINLYFCSGHWFLSFTMD